MCFKTNRCTCCNSHLEREVGYERITKAINDGIEVAMSFAACSSAVLADNHGTSTKPAGAMGSGSAQADQAKPNQFWWPEQLNLGQLRDHDARSNPLGADFDYAAAASELDSLIKSKKTFALH